MILIESNQNHAVVRDTEICTTLPASMGLGGGYIPMILTTSKASYHINAIEDVASSLVATDYKDPQIVVRGGDETQPIMMSDRKGHNGISDNGIGTTLTSQEKERPLIGMSTVRRLTPVECERLQGFPDGWTDIGEWTDSKGKKRETVDSARYKALGNSIALPFWFYLLRRISALYERPATLGSLFDGIGGFPLCWERCNGQGTAIWASEIEEFPIAVTKVHFPEKEE